jgi:hypothetical protein
MKSWGGEDRKKEGTGTEKKRTHIDGHRGREVGDRQGREFAENPWKTLKTSSHDIVPWLGGGWL